MLYLNLRRGFTRQLRCCTRAEVPTLIVSDGRCSRPKARLKGQYGECSKAMDAELQAMPRVCLVTVVKATRQQGLN